MKRIALFILHLSLFTLHAYAQRTPVEKYEIAPASFEQVYLDHVQGYPCRIIDIGMNQYLGQADKQGTLYGYGMFVNSDGSQIIGKFRNGELLFGITITQNAALVGDRNFYASYSLTTGRIEFIYKANERVVTDTKNMLDYGFVSMTYANGDQYMGEVYQRKRHGFGVYYYANGDFWFGEYDNDVRTGFGALFHVEGGLEIGQWRGEDEVRVIPVKAKK